MVALVSLIVMFSGLAGIVFHRPLARSMMKYYPEPEQLVPKAQHPSIPGGPFWEALHSNGVGGFSIWGK